MSKALLAKFGVFALIVVNLGAYYVFWPNTTPLAPGENGKASAVEKPDNSGKPFSIASSAGTAQPADPVKPSLLQGDAAPGAIPPPEPIAKPPLPVADPLIGVAAPVANDLPVIPRPTDPGPLPGAVAALTPVKAEDTTIAQLKRLKESFDKEEGSQLALPTPVLPPAEPANLQPGPDTDEKAVFKPMQGGTSPWSLEVAVFGRQKVLVARLNKRAEFRIVCDNLEKTVHGDIVAMGKVTFIGPGLNGSCGRLTLGLVADSLVLEGHAEVQIQQGGVSDPVAELKGEQLTLRLQQPAAASTPVQPLTVTPATPPPVSFEIPPALPLNPVQPGAAPLGGPVPVPSSAGR